MRKDRISLEQLEWAAQEAQDGATLKRQVGALQAIQTMLIGQRDKYYRHWKLCFGLLLFSTAVHVVNFFPGVARFFFGG